MVARDRSWLPLVVSMALIAACDSGAAKPDGGGGTGGASGSEGGTGGTNVDGFATAHGASVLVPAVARVIFQSTGGGFRLQPPAGAACSSGVWTYTLDVVTGAFTWSTCDVSGTGSNTSDYVTNMGMRTLPATQLETAKAAIADVHVSTRMGCGADKDNWTLQVASTTASLTYGDDFYICTMMYQHYVASEDLSPLRSVMDLLAH